MSTDDRVQQVLDQYAGPHADAAWLLCDRHDPDTVALRFIAADLDVTPLTYGELADRSRRIAAALAARGIGKGTRVATLMGKSPELLAVALGIWRVGAVSVPLFTAFAPDTVVARLKAANVRLLFTDRANAHKAQDRLATCEAVVVDAEDDDAFAAMLDTTPSDETVAVGGDGPLVHMFTSGTTGPPKNVVHPLKYAADWQVYLEFGLGVTPPSRFWSAADPGWAYGLYTAIVAPLAAGVTTRLVEGGFDSSRTWKVLEQEQITDFAAAPTIYRELRRRDQPTGALSLEHLSSAGEPLTPDVNQWATRRLGLTVHDHYGQTELGMVLGYHHHPDVATSPRDNAMGTPLPGWALDVLALDDWAPAQTDVLGRLAVRVTDSPLMTFTGYHGTDDTSKFSPDGRWYVTGDVARMDESGEFFFSARDDDVIIMAGYRIGPFDIETVLTGHPRVAECAVTAMPDDLRGEVLVAHVVLDGDPEGDDELTAELQQLVRDKYAAHAYPRRVYYAAALPKTPSGKIKRTELRNATNSRGERS